MHVGRWTAAVATSCRCMVPRGLILGLGAKDAALHTTPEFTLRGGELVIHLHVIPELGFENDQEWEVVGKWALVLETRTDANDGVKTGIHHLMLLNTILTSISTT